MQSMYHVGLYIASALMANNKHWRYSITHVTYYVRHKAETHENRRFFRTGIEFAENAYAYVLKAPSRS